VLARQVPCHLSHASSSFCFDYVGDSAVSHFLPRLAWTVTLLFYTSCIAGMCHHTQFLFSVMRSYELPCPGWPGTMTVLIPDFCIALDERHIQPLLEMGVFWTICPGLPHLRSSQSQPPK
jgi:hypothetical protein